MGTPSRGTVTAFRTHGLLTATITTSEWISRVTAGGIYVIAPGVVWDAQLRIDAIVGGCSIVVADGCCFQLLQSLVKHNAY